MILNHAVNEADSRATHILNLNHNQHQTSMSEHVIFLRSSEVLPATLSLNGWRSIASESFASELDVTRWLGSHHFHFHFGHPAASSHFNSKSCWPIYSSHPLSSSAHSAPDGLSPSWAMRGRSWEVPKPCAPTRPTPRGFEAFEPNRDRPDRCVGGFTEGDPRIGAAFFLCGT